MDYITFDHLATLSEGDALRERLAARNLRLLPWVVLIFVFVALIQMAIAGDATTGGGVALALAFGNAVALVFLHLVLRRARRTRTGQLLARLEPLARPVRAHATGVVTWFLVAQYLAVVAYVTVLDGTQGWPMAFPPLVLLFRLAPFALTLVHSTFTLVGVLEPVLRGPGDDYIAVLIAVVTINLGSLLFGLFLERRARARFHGEWSQAMDQHRDQLRMRQELEVARELQLSMLPESAPDVPWLDVASMSIPATEVGGDYFDYFPRSDDRFVVVAADVAGHGIASGLVLSGLRSCLTMLEDELDDRVGVLEKLHRMIRRTSHRRMMATLALAALDRQAGTLSVVSAGHPPILIRRGASGEVEEVEVSSLPLGAGLTEGFQERQLEVGPTDVVVLYTDGLYETVDEAGEPFGIDRLADVLRAVETGRESSEIRDAVLQALWAFKGQAPQHDDITLVVVTLG